MTPAGHRGLAVLPLVACALLFVAGALGAQVVEDPPPPPTDTIPTDTLRAGADTLLVEEPPPPPRHLAQLPRPVPAVGMATGVWEWDREALLNVRALAITDLLVEIPGVVRHRSGDYGFPSAISAFGAGGGRVRVFYDGFEVVPLEGGTLDLSRIGMGTLERVRVERFPGELRIDLFSLTIDDPRPYTFIHVATGDLNTNLLRGVFHHPRLLGGSLAVGIDRLDSQGVNRQEPGSMSSGWFRYSWVPSDRWGVGLEFRRQGAERDADLYPPGELTRTDWIVRGRFRVAEGVVADAFWGHSSMRGEMLESAQEPDPEDPQFNFKSRSQAGVRVRGERELFGDVVGWGEGSARLNGGAGWADNVTELRAGMRGPRLGGFEGAWEREGWAGDEVATGVRLKAWTPALFGLSLFGSWEDGRRGMPLPSVAQPPAQLPDVLFTQRSATRLGASFDVGEIALGAAWVRMEADVLAPLGFAAERPGDAVTEGDRPRDGLVLPGGVRTGLEASANIPLVVLDGLALAGSAQLWDTSESWRYLPRRIYDARVAFHDVFLPTENLEVWADIGVRGRDPMAVPLPGADPAETARVPFDQSWFARLQIRVVTVRVFVDWENVFARQQNQDYPGRLMPATRTIYGVRWSLWN